MRRYRTLLLVVLLGIVPAAIALSVSMWLYFGSDEEVAVPLEPEPVVASPPEPVVPPVEVLAGARNMPAGTLLTANDLTYVPLEARNVLSSHIRREPTLESSNDSGAHPGGGGRPVATAGPNGLVSLSGDHL